MPLLTIQNKAVCSPHEVFRLTNVLNANQNVLSVKQNV